MNGPFELAVVLYSLGIAAAFAVTAVRGRVRGPLLLPSLLMVEVTLLAQAAVDVSRLARGMRPAEPATHIGYLMASIAILPIAAGSVRLDDGRWGNLALAVGCLVVAVVSVRLHQTLGVVRHG